MNVSITTESFEGDLFWGIGSCERYQRYGSWETHTATCCLDPGAYTLICNPKTINFIPVSASTEENSQSNGGFFTIQDQRYCEDLNDDNYYDSDDVNILGKLYSISTISLFTISGKNEAAIL